MVVGDTAVLVVALFDIARMGLGSVLLFPDRKLTALFRSCSMI